MVASAPRVLSVSASASGVVKSENFFKRWLCVGVLAVAS